MQLCSKTQGGTRNRTRDLPNKGSAFITSSDHWTLVVMVVRAYASRGSRALLVCRAVLLIPARLSYRVHVALHT